MVTYHASTIPVPCESGVTRRVLAYSDKLMLCEVRFEKGARGAAHSHPHAQICYVKSGAFAFTVGERTETVREGDSVYVPEGATHGVLALEEGTLIDAFSPMRETFV